MILNLYPSKAQLKKTKNKKTLHNRFLLFVVVMFDKVATNTELENKELLLLGEIQVLMSLWSQHFHQLINT